MASTKNLVTKNLKINSIKQIQESITEPANNTYYLMIGRCLPYEGGDSLIEQPVESVKEELYTSFDNFTAGKKITADDVKRVSNQFNLLYDANKSTKKTKDKLTNQNYKLISS